MDFLNRSLYLAMHFQVSEQRLTRDCRLSCLLLECRQILLVLAKRLPYGVIGEESMYNYTAIDPERDYVELLLAKLALQNNIPILGICRGIQMLNVAAGGDIYQDLAARKGGTLIHDHKAPRCYPTHGVEIQPETKLFKILGESRLRVNSYRHQAVRKVAADFRVSALASDGVIEAIEHSSLRYAVGVQWHPEQMWQRYPLFKQLFTALVEEASK